ncbi:MAG: IS1380 family transposase [Actinobacteria bacterium]|nr:MAG: IS1380 family transposase [Actinomycetota bacterium]
MRVKLAGRSALVQIAPSSQEITAHAGLVLVRELTSVLGVAELLDQMTVKKRARGYSPAQQALALCETLIAGGECLDDAALLRADGAQEQLRGHAIPDPTTLGRFLASFNLGHIRQFERALEQLFARVHPLLERETVTLDLDATLVEHHGPAGSRQGTRGTYTGKIAWHPLLCFVGETGEWLHGKLRNGHAHASAGSKRFLADCLRRLPDGARVFLRADEGFWGQDFFAELEQRQVTYAIGAPQIRSVKARIAAIPAGDWRPSSYRAGSEVASFSWRPKTWKRERRFVVRRDPIEPGEQLSLDGGDYHYYALVTNDHERSADELERWHRAKANVENRIKEAKLGLGLDNLPCRGFHANWAYLLCTLLAYNLLCWLKLLALPARERLSYAKRLRFRFIAVAATVGRSGRRLLLRLSAGYPLLNDFVEALQRVRGLARAPA